MSPSPFLRLRDCVRDCLAAMGAPGDLAIKGVVLEIPGHEHSPIRIPFFAASVLSDLEREVVEAIRRADAPLQQKEIAKAARVSLRLVQKTTPALKERGIILRHPTQGFFLPGQAVSE